MKPSNEMKKVFILLLIIGTVFIIGCAKYWQSFISFKNNAIETTAIITKIESDWSELSKKSYYTVFIEFVVDGKIYSGELGYYTSEMDVGKTIKIYYNPDNPKDFRVFAYELMGIFMFMGIIFFLVGFGWLLNSIMKVRNKKKEKRMVETGTKIYAEFKEVRKDMMFIVNGKSPYKIVCTSDNPDINEYVSETIWRYPEEIKIIEEKNITSFPVYIDKENPSKYYLATEEIDEYIR